MRLKLVLAIVLPFAMTSFLGCQTNKSERPRTGGNGGEGEEPEEVTYEGWVKGFLSTNCESCHGAGAEDGPDLSTYAKVKAAQKKIVTRMESDDAKKKMPPKKTLKDEQIEKFKAWVEQKMPEGKKKGGTAVAKITYNGWIKKYEKDSCGSGSTGCHASGNANGADLSSFEESKDAASASLGSIKSKRMPKGNADADATVISKYEAWIKAGMPEDDDSGTDTGTGSGTGTGTGTGTGGSEEAKEAGFDLLKSAKGCGVTGCHNAGAIPPVLDSDEKLEAAKDAVLRTTKGGTMPKANPYDAANKKVIQEWYDSL